LVFPDRVSLYSSGGPGTHFVDQAGPELRNPPASAGIKCPAGKCILNRNPRSLFFFFFASKGSRSATWLSTFPKEGPTVYAHPCLDPLLCKKKLSAKGSRTPEAGPRSPRAFSSTQPQACAASCFEGKRSPRGRRGLTQFRRSRRHHQSSRIKQALCNSARAGFPISLLIEERLQDL
jgi:hypothetical protein